MNLPKKKKCEIEGIISPVAMASLQTQFMVGNRQQFGFLLGNVVISNEAYRCDDSFCPNTFYITSVKPIFDAASFTSDLLKSNDKSVSETFMKHAVKNNIMEPILGWYFEGNPNEFLKGRDYSLHLKLLRQISLLKQSKKNELLDRFAYYALFAAVVSCNKKRFSRDFSVGFQGFNEKNQLRMYDVKVNVVDHYFRPRYESDVCLLNHSKILNYIKAEVNSESIRNVFERLQVTVFDRPEPHCYIVHGHFIDRCFDLLCGILMRNCSRAAESRNIELESQLFDYKAFDVDSKAYLAATAVIDKIERNLNLYDIMVLLTNPYRIVPSSIVSMVQADLDSPQLLNPPILVDTLEEIRQSTAEEGAEVVSSAKLRSSNTEEKNRHVSLPSGSNDHNLKDSVDIQVGEASIQASRISEEVSTESTLAESSVSQVPSVHQDRIKTSDDDSSSKAFKTEVSESKKRRQKKRKHSASLVSEKDDSATAAANSAPQQSSDEQHSGKQSSEQTSPFSNVPRDQLLVYSITPPKSSEMKPSDLMPLHDKSDELGKTRSATKISQHESVTSEKEDIADSKPTNMKIKIVKRNTSARINIPLTFIEEASKSTESIEKSTKKKDESSDTGSGLLASIVRNLKKIKAELSAKKNSPDSADSGSTSSLKHVETEQNLASVISQDAKHPNEKCEEQKCEEQKCEEQKCEEQKCEEQKCELPQTGVHVSGLTDGSEKSITADSSRKVRSKKSKSQKSTSQPQLSSGESSKLPWPRSENACFMIPKIKDVSPVNELWKYTLHPIPESLLTALKCLRAWRNEANVEEQTCSSSDSSTNVSPAGSDEQLLPDFQEAFGSLLNTESWKNQPCEGELLPSISEVTAEPPQSSGSILLPRQEKEQNRPSSRKRSLCRKLAFQSTKSTSPLETVFEEGRSTSVQYERTSRNERASDNDEVIPLCLLGDKFMITAVSTEEKYAPLSTISSSDSDDSDTDTSTSSHSPRESFSH